MAMLRKRLLLGGLTGLTATAYSAVSLTEEQHTPSVPAFKLGGSQYDTETYIGRVKNILHMIDPRTLLVSDTELKRCQDLLSAFEESGALPHGMTDVDMWSAQSTVNAIIHEPTGEKMFAAGRMSSFVLMNVPTCAGMLIQGPHSTVAAVFWQWANQTYNVVNNYVNRAGPDVDYQELLVPYSSAVTVSMAIAFASGILMKRRPALRKFGVFVPYCAVVTSGSLNVAFTRMDEIRNGINISDHEGNTLGRSVTAGKLAVFKTVTTRSMFLPIFPLLVPTVSMHLLSSAGLLIPQSPAFIAVQLAMITMSFAVALPCALAIQPSTMTLGVSTLEEEFQGLTDSEGKPIEYVYASKGM